MYGVRKHYFHSVSHTTAALSANHPQLGDTREEGADVYQWIYNAGGSQASQGRGMVHSVTVGTGAYSLTVSSTTSVDLCAGVVKNSTIAAGEYGWLLVRGTTCLKSPANSGLAAGALVVLAADGESINKDISTGYVSPAFGKVITLGGSGSTTAVAFIRCY